jgi:hypothetical protein
LLAATRERELRIQDNMLRVRAENNRLLLGAKAGTAQSFSGGSTGARTSNSFFQVRAPCASKQSTAGTVGSVSTNNERIIESYGSDLCFFGVMEVFFYHAFV